MNIDESFQLLRMALESGSPPPNPSTNQASCHRRLAMALAQAPHGEAGTGDVAVLVRQFLRRESERQESSQRTRCKARPGLPARQDWDRFGVSVSSSEEVVTLTSRAWRPEWLDGSDIGVDSRAVRELNRRNFNPAKSDPFLKRMELVEYRCTAQRQAVRSVLTAAPGSTLVVNIPTGAGKSLCAQLPAILNSRQAGVTVVVVPTTALCLDQELALRKFIPHDTAYFSAVSDDRKRRNEMIRERIKSGSQKIVFVSPEGLICSLTSALYTAAERGFLRMLVIDEAHLVDGWGDSFRPEFQQLGGLRTDLLRHCAERAFVTLLMSATITSDCLQNLRALFGEPGPFRMIASVQLRPEPEYWSAYCESEDVRTARLMEALHFLPRPLIVYTTQVQDAVDWHLKFRNAGFLRCGLFTGKTPDDERARMLDMWKAQQLDIMVATSAFGLGVDVADIRAVIHACVPESLDRFYQEVGRGGRDGAACVSLALYTKYDFVVAHRMSVRAGISVDKGFERWRAMFNQKSVPSGASEGVYRVSLESAPKYDPDLAGARNEKWNVFTLNLMSKAGLIKLDWQQPPQRRETAVSSQEDANSERQFELEWEKYRSQRLVQILQQDHLNKSLWEKQVGTVRVSFGNVDSLAQLFSGKHCAGEILRATYRIEPFTTNNSPFLEAWPSSSCGGCKFCRKQNRAPYAGDVPQVLPVWDASVEIKDELRQLMLTHRLLAIFYSADSLHWPKRRKEALKRLVTWGIYNVITPNALRDELFKELANVHNQFVFWDSEFNELFLPKLPSAIVHMDTIVPPNLLYDRPDMPPRVVFLPESAADPENPHRKLIDCLWPKMNFDEFVERSL